MEPPAPIEAPVGFPSLEELLPLIEVDIGELHYPRARIRSGWVSVPDGDRVKTITHYDDLTVLDHPGGLREVVTATGETLVQGEDGTWKDSDRFEWSVADAFWAWDAAQEWARQTIDGGAATLQGFATVASVPTAHYTVASDGKDRAGTRTVTDIWVDESGAVMRLVTTMPSPDLETAYLMWDVQTLAPVLQGPLPPAHGE
jgi:hypothetical protein